MCRYLVWDQDCYHPAFVSGPKLSKVRRTAFHFQLDLGSSGGGAQPRSVHLDQEFLPHCQARKATLYLCRCLGRIPHVSASILLNLQLRNWELRADAPSLSVLRSSRLPCHKRRTSGKARENRRETGDGVVQQKKGITVIKKI